jgi:hypothetical protein
MSKDVILKKALTTGGFDFELVNSASLLNKGIEVTIGADPIATGSLRWHTDIMLTKNVGTVEYIDGVSNMMAVSNSYEGKAYRFIVGEKIGTMWGYLSDGIWKSYNTPNATDYPAGSYRYKDLNIDGEIKEEDDMSIIGCGQPSFNWSWSNTLTYKSFDLSIFLLGYHGFDIYNDNEWLTIIDGHVSPNPDWLDRWRPGHEETDIPGFIPNNNDKSFVSRKVEKGDFVKIKNITIGYTLPNSLTERFKIHNLRVYASLQNLHTFTGYSGIDPEVTLKNALTPGADWGYYPNGRNFIFGLNFTF